MAQAGKAAPFAARDHVKAFTLLKKHRHRLVQTGLIPLLVLGAVAFVHLSRPSPPIEVSLDSLILALAVVHVDLSKGGLLSRLVYSVTPSYNLRNFVTVSAAFAWTAAFIALLPSASEGPLMFLFAAPITLAAARGGVRLSLPAAFVVAALVSMASLNGTPEGTAQGVAVAGVLLFVGLVVGVIVGRLRRAALDLSALYETGKAISSSLKLEETLPLVLNIVMLDLRADASLLVLLDEETGRARVEAQRGLPEELTGRPVPDEDFIVDYVVRLSRSVCIGQRYAEPVIGVVPEFGSVLAVPLVLGGEPVGALVAGSYREHAFSRESIRFMEALASQAATAIENGRLFGQAHQWAIRDGLTGLYNYRYFAERVADEISRSHRYGGSVAVIMIDVDLFKRINDTWGHMEGDEALRQIAELLEYETRETDIVARYGGEEFAIILPQTPVEAAFVVADKLREVVAAHDFHTTETRDVIRMTISCGVAGYPQSAETTDELLRIADVALYEAKSSRNVVRKAPPLAAADSLSARRGIS
ncbi:MAG: sensor domain-containing diguanylate cyclase [Actinobacteria bacterium]|nr:MAG: sensor domain-containing diguanylate cyclase [Actinomycetota bacterium]